MSFARSARSISTSCSSTSISSCSCSSSTSSTSSTSSSSSSLSFVSTAVLMQHSSPLSTLSVYHSQPVGIYPKKYEWAARPSSSSGVLHLDLHPPPPMQIGGDCSLWIRSATLDFDDGLWECQVTASEFTAQDALTSQPVRLVVRGKCYLAPVPLSSCNTDADTDI